AMSPMQLDSSSSSPIIAASPLPPIPSIQLGPAADNHVSATIRSPPAEAAFLPPRKSIELRRVDTRQPPPSPVATASGKPSTSQDEDRATFKKTVNSNVEDKQKNVEKKRREKRQGSSLQHDNDFKQMVGGIPYSMPSTSRNSYRPTFTPDEEKEFERFTEKSKDQCIVAGCSSRKTELPEECDCTELLGCTHEPPPFEM
ncbi:hypothetical protein PFISCL1PPCAC_2671, partial [Pristionchus fissidentatus]